MQSVLNFSPQVLVLVDLYSAPRIQRSISESTVVDSDAVVGDEIAYNIV